MEARTDRCDNGNAQFILYSDGGIQPPCEPGRSSRYEFVVYVTQESMYAAQIDSDGMVEVMIREGRQVWEEYSGESWIIWHREYRAKFPHAFLVRRGLEAGYSNLFPRLPDLYKKPVVCLSADLMIEVETSPAPLTREEFVDQIHRFHNLTRYWSQERDHPIYELKDQGEIEAGSVKLAFVHLAHDYLEENGWARFAYDKSIDYASKKRSGIKRHATFREVLTFSRNHDVDQLVAGFMALGSRATTWSSRAQSYTAQYPRLVLQGHVRSFDFLHDNTGYGGYGETYLVVVVEE